ARLAAVEDAVAGAERAQDAARADRDRWTARADALALALDDARARAGAERLAGVAGALGSLLRLGEGGGRRQEAFEAARGDGLAAGVVDSVAGARRAVWALRGEGVGGAVVPAGRLLPPRPLPPVGEPVRRHVRSGDGRVEHLLDILVGAAVAVDGDWAAAV